MNIPLILASSSKARLELLAQIKLKPDLVISTDIDETPRSKELPAKLASRLAYEKSLAAQKQIDKGIIITADTVVSVGRRILPKAITQEDISFCMNLLSGRRHRVATAICVVRKDSEKIKLLQRLVVSIVKFKTLTMREINDYVKLEEGLNKAGGYSLQGVAASFTTFISGSYSNIIGLPLFETKNLLNSLINQKE